MRAYGSQPEEKTCRWRGNIHHVFLTSRVRVKGTPLGVSIRSKKDSWIRNAIYFQGSVYERVACMSVRANDIYPQWDLWVCGTHLVALDLHNLIELLNLVTRLHKHLPDFHFGDPLPNI